MSACGAEFGWSERDGVVCRLAVHSHGDHEALICGNGNEYGGAERRAVAKVTWPMSDEHTVRGPVGHRDRQGRCEALDESEGEA